MFKQCLIASLLVMGLSTNAYAKLQSYKIDSNHAHVVWSIEHLGFAKTMGQFTDISGIINFDKAKPEAGSAQVVIKTAGVNSGIPALDEHLRSKDFFNVKEFPQAYFTSKKIIVTGKDTADIEGEFTLLGVVKPLTLKVKFNKEGLHPKTQKQAVGFSATTTVKRSQYGMGYGVPMVGEQVDLIIEVEAQVE